MIVLSVNRFLKIRNSVDEWLSEYDMFTCMEMMRKTFLNIPEDTLGSILRQVVKKREICNINHLPINAIKEEYEHCKSVGHHGICLNLSKKYKVSPMSIARKLIDIFNEENKKKGIKYKYGINLSTIKTKNQIKNPNIIDEPYLSFEVYLASIYDLAYSRLSHIITALIGEEYEIFLEDSLKVKGICFKTEKDLRKSEARVSTPDIFFQIPVAYKNKCIKWIESKALFADQNSHLYYTRKQYHRYVKEYGPGLVIYWLGHTDSSLSTKEIMVTHTFPDCLVQLK